MSVFGEISNSWSNNLLGRNVSKALKSGRQTLLKH